MLLKSLFALTVISPFISTDAYAGPEIESGNPPADFSATVSAPAALLYAVGTQEARADLIEHSGETTVRAPAAVPAAAPDQGADPGSPWAHYLVGLLLSGVALVAGRRA